MTRPRILDLFCGAGGAAMGYWRAGFDVLGVDLHPQPNYPFDFFQGDAIEFLQNRMPGGYIGRLEGFHAIHASPVCHKWSELSKVHPGRSESSPDYITPTRQLLKDQALPWVMENVESAPIAASDDLFGNYGITLCGTMFGRRVYRHRCFESSFPVSLERACNHTLRAWNPHNVAGRQAMRDEGLTGDLERPWRNGLGVGWMGRYEAREAIPPYFTEFLARRMPLPDGLHLVEREGAPVARVAQETALKVSEEIVEGIRELAAVSVAVDADGDGVCGHASSVTSRPQESRGSTQYPGEPTTWDDDPIYSTSVKSDYREES